MTDHPVSEARAIIERALEPFAPSRTQLKKMVAAVMQEWMAQRPPTSVTVEETEEQDGPARIATREEQVEHSVLVLLHRTDIAGIA